MPRRLLAVLNPSAHDFEARDRWPSIERELRATAEVTLVETDRDDAVTRARVVAATRGGSFDRVVSIGGDGTLHLVVNALVLARPDALPELAVIPFGTANDVARTLELPLHDVGRLARVAAGSALAWLDLARVRTSERGSRRDERVFVNSVGVGMDADVLFARGRSWRDLGGYLGYAAALAERSIEQRSLDARVSVDGAPAFATHAFNVLVTDAPVYAAELRMPGGSHDDGLLDVYLFDRLEYGSKLLSFAIQKADVLGLGIGDLLDSVTENQRAFHGRSVAIDVLGAPRRVQVDGEALASADRIECEVAGRIRVAVG